MSEYPDSWVKFKLGNIADVTWGDTATTKKSYVNEGYTAFSASGPDGYLDHFDYDQTGIVVSAIGAQCGKIWKASGKWSCIKNTMRILPTSDAVSIDYLYQFLSIDAFPKRGTGQPFIRQQDAREISVLCPPLPEQQRIVDILDEQFSRLDAALTSIRTVKAKSARFRRSLLRAAFEGELSDDGTAEWETLTLKDVARWGSGGTPKAKNPDYYGGSIPWAVIGDLNDGAVKATAQSITEEGLQNSSAKVVPPGSVLIAMYGSIGKLAINEVPMATNQAIAFAVPKPDVIDRDFLFNYLLSQRNEFIGEGTGTTQMNISQTILKPWPIPVPPLSVQRDVVRLVNEQSSRLAAALAIADQLESRIAAERRSLLHAAFTGALTARWRENQHG